MKTLTRENNNLKEVREAIKEFGNIGTISLKDWEQVIVDSEFVEVLTTKRKITIYQNIHGTFGFGTTR